MAQYAAVFGRSFPAGRHRHGDLHPVWAIPWPTSWPGSGACLRQMAMHAHHAAHVDELPAAHLLLDVPAGAQRLFQHAVLDLTIGLPKLDIIDTQGAVVLGMVYNFLPFMILPIFSVIEKIDPGSSRRPRTWAPTPSQVFRRVIFPLSLPGVLSGVTMVFIPSVSTFVISRLLGGGKSLLLGDLIEMQFLGTAYNPHLGSAISLVMMVIVLVCMGIMNRFGEGEEEAVLL